MLCPVHYPGLLLLIDGCPVKDCRFLHFECGGSILNAVRTGCLYRVRVAARCIGHDKFAVDALLAVREVPALVCDQREIDDTGTFDTGSLDILKDLHVLETDRPCRCI